MASKLPQQALSWLTRNERRVLLVGANPALARELALRHHDVTVVDPSYARLRRLGASDYVRPLVCDLDALPLAPYYFATVLVSQNLHTLSERTLSELTRVLAPYGQISITYTTRDDTVPWVKRLAAIMQDADPTAMRGDYGTDAVDSDAVRRYFPELECVTHRTWHPITRDELLQMVANRPATAAMNVVDRERLFHDVGALYDSVARRPDPLLLPYEVSCWRGYAQHTELSVPITIDDGLRLFG